ncbi:MAG: MBL fold metallo-hydrolase [Methanobacteriaceae archaeon]|nr:MBL fold metallo-hydrolase [Methanobacteriaceae archaeon]MDO9627902.1 MBL fold metallo-hydrolase [Methanobacteriaceae archaeon]
MKIIPLAFESLGVRSMCTFVQTDQGILIDPGTSVAPKRFKLPPSLEEITALKESREKIVEYSKKSSIITISHYHHDHFTPFESNKFLESSSKIAYGIYSGKKIFLKNPDSNINKNQSSRAKKLIKNLKSVDDTEITYSDNQEFQIGDTNIKFSSALHHGSDYSHLGYIVAVSITFNGEKLLHASDVQGPISDMALEYILNENPDRIILSGPPLYLLGYALSDEDITKARANLEKICQKIPHVVVDHHLLRTKKGLEFINDINEMENVDVMPASCILQKKPLLLESERKTLYKPLKTESSLDKYLK